MASKDIAELKRERVVRRGKSHRPLFASLTDGRVSDEKLSWREVARAVLSPQTWLTAGAYFGLLSGIYSFGLFVGLRSPSLRFMI